MVGDSTISPPCTEEAEADIILLVPLPMLPPTLLLLIIIIPCKVDEDPVRSEVEGAWDTEEEEEKPLRLLILPLLLKVLVVLLFPMTADRPLRLGSGCGG